MNTSRLEAFSDGVIAVIITIMVLELRTPQGSDLAALLSVLPTFLVYVVSFSVIGTYWNNHHHLIRTARRLNGKIMWANLHLLFWLSLIPFFTTWLGQNYRAVLPTALYGVLLLVCAGAYQFLQVVIIADQPKDSFVTKRIGRDVKGVISLSLYVAAVGLSFVNHWLADAIYIIVAAAWFLPDRRLEPASRD